MRQPNGRTSHARTLTRTHALRAFGRNAAPTCCNPVQRGTDMLQPVQRGTDMLQPGATQHDTL
jgi:hypothetical protein